MEKVKMTTAFMRGLRPGECRTYADTEMRNLQVHVNRTTITYQLLFKHHQRQWHTTLGEHPVMTLEEARNEALRRIAIIVQGGNPDAGRPRHGAPTLGDAMDAYLAYLKERRSQSYLKTCVSDFKLYAPLRNRKVTTVTRDDILRVHRANSCRPVMANHALSAMRTAMSRLIAEECLAIVNPCRGIDMYDMKPRERYLTREEAPRFIEAVKKLQLSGLHYVQADVIMMMLFTGARPSNTMSMRLEDIDENHVWTIPKGWFKDRRRSHSIQLGEHEMEIVERHRGCRTSGPVFEWHGKAIRDIRKTMKKACEMAGMSDFHPHDLRRTLGTWMLSVGSPIEVVSKKLGHSSIRVTETVYAHLLPDVARKATEEAISALLGTPPPTE